MIKELAPNIFSVTSRGFFSVPIFVFVKENGKVTIIDTGLKKDSKSFLRQFKVKWGHPNKIERIIFTHRHLDHTAGLPFLLDAMSEVSAPEIPVEIVCHEEEAKKMKEEENIAAPYITRFVKDGETIDNELKLKAIHTPGHTLGHLCVLAEDKGLLFVGDLVMKTLRLRTVFKVVHDDYEQYLKTLPKILEHSWDYFVPSHMRATKIPREKMEKFILKKAKK